MNMNPGNKKLITIFFFTAAIILRLLLCWVNPPSNSYDDHYEPIFLIIKNGVIPAKNACFECYHPPVFYWISAMVGRSALYFGATLPQLMKLLQFVNCFYGILTVFVVYLILNKLPLSDFSKIIAFGTVCFLPRHIYMGAMNSNDTISYLFTSICIYLVLVAIEKKLNAAILVLLSLATTAAIFTKYTSLVVFPVIAGVFLLLMLNREYLTLKKKISSLILVLSIPSVFFIAYTASNLSQYGKALPDNFSSPEIRSFILRQAHDAGGASFFDFKPWESVKNPLLAPGKMSSFWTLVYSGTWFDIDPMFLKLDQHFFWWDRHYAWLRGEGGYPGVDPDMSSYSLFLGSALIILGLLPFALVILGFFMSLKMNRRRGWADIDNVKLNIFPILFISNAAIVVSLVLKLPVYSTMKASYLLNSLPAFAVFLALALMRLERHKRLKEFAVLYFGILFVFVSAHIFNLVSTINLYNKTFLTGF